MPTTDARVDSYIAKSADFARPILERLREQIHAACPQVEETIKWGFPHFIYAGGILCYIAAFKKHATLGFKKAELLTGIPRGKDKDAMGQFGRLLSISDLPSRRTLSSLVRYAAKLNREGIKIPPREPKQAASPSAMPDELATALSRNKVAQTSYEKFPPGEQREYRDWVAEAKREVTRHRRAAQAVEWLAQGKKRNWKYTR